MTISLTRIGPGLPSRSPAVSSWTLTCGLRRRKELRVVRADREKRERNEDAEFIRKAVRAGKFPGARADHYMTLMQADRDGTRKFIEDLPEGLPVTEMGNLGSLDDALKASDYPEGWLTAGERRRIKKAQAAYADGVVGDVEPGEIIREA
jgi:hypothetical protein